MLHRTPMRSWAMRGIAVRVGQLCQCCFDAWSADCAYRNGNSTRCGLGRFIEWSQDCSYRNGNSTRRPDPCGRRNAGKHLPIDGATVAASARLWRIVGGYTPQPRVIRHSNGLSVIGGSREGTGLASVEPDRASPKKDCASAGRQTP